MIIREAPEGDVLMFKLEANDWANKERALAILYDFKQKIPAAGREWDQGQKCWWVKRPQWRTFYELIKLWYPQALVPDLFS